jgi:hypothetical protein
MASSQQHSSDEVCVATQCMDDADFTLTDDAEVAVVEEKPKPWAAMVSLADNIRHEFFPISGTAADGSGRYHLHSLGRSKKCTICILTSPTISNNHCNIYCKINEAADPSLDPSLRMEAWIEDLSNNGTYMNRSTRLVKNIPRMLHHNDEVYLINPAYNKATDGSLSPEVMKHAYLFMSFLPSANEKFPTKSPSVIPVNSSIDRTSTVVRMLNQHRTVQEYYEFKGKLGEGAMGTVYEGISKLNGSRWAIKCLDARKLTFNTSVTTSDVVREAELIRKLRHPNIIHLEDVFSDERNLYLVMELSHGEMTDSLSFGCDPNYSLLIRRRRFVR